jgi:phosphoribosyl-ATP pyrophosphohydrolase
MLHAKSRAGLLDGVPNRLNARTMSKTADVLTELMAVIEDRKAHPPARSYTTSLFAAGVEKIGAKLIEEAEEVVDAARRAETQVGRDHLTHEAADLLYHLFVMMGYRGITLDDVSMELARRFGTSGLDEKAARTRNDE